MNQFTGTGSVESLGPREIGVIASTNQLARDGHVLEPSGIDLIAYKRNPIVLFDHNAGEPVGIATAVGLEGNALGARIEFAPEGISMRADEVCGLVKAGFLRGVSIGFLPTEIEPLDPKDPWGGQHITESELLEISLVAVPADTGAGVTARAFRASQHTRAMLRSLPRTSTAAQARALETIKTLTRGLTAEEIAEYGLGPRAREAIHVPIGAMNQYERARATAEAYRARTMTTWAIGMGKQTEDDARYSAEARRARLDALIDRNRH